MSKEQKIIYYDDELNDEFAQDNIVAKKIDGNYRYIRDDFLGKIGHVFWYRIIAIPMAWIYMKMHFHHKIINKKILKKYKNKGYFMYGNHTHFMADALNPTMVNMPKTVSVIVHPNNVSMPFLGKITPSLGALPLPDDTNAAKNFVKAIESCIEKKHCVMIYPEAHIWPYYTKIRPFKDTSFRYPVQYDVPTFCMTNTYQKRKWGKHPKIVTYIDGPFFSDKALKARQQKTTLRDQVYEKMCERAQYNNVCLVKYVKDEDEK